MTKDDVYIYPTDTVWGIGSSIYSEKGYLDIAEIKRTSTDKPLSVLFNSREQILSFFKLPIFMDEKWFKSLFSLEATMQIPLEWKQKDIPKWIYQKSEFLNIRCLKGPIIGAIIEELNGPITTTSLNISGTPPIKDRLEAINFHQKYAPNTIFKDSKEELSGHSSTIISFNKDGMGKIVRSGRFADEIKKGL
jgi:L-threonylcarbamoyladenylate synthase